MIVLSLPFNRLIGLKAADRAEYIFMLEDKEGYRNHLGTVHAAAQYALSEATAGELLLNNFDGVYGRFTTVLRKASVRYRKPANGCVYSSGVIDDTAVARAKHEIQERGRTLLDVSVWIEDRDRNKTFEGVFSWFISKEK